MANDVENLASETLDDVVKKTGIFTGLFTSDKKIGDLNGRWAAAFKILIVLLFLTIPSWIGWNSWLTLKTFKLEEHVAVTADQNVRIKRLEDGAVQRQWLERQLNKLVETIQELSPEQLQLRVSTLEELVKRVPPDVYKTKFDDLEQEVDDIVDHMEQINRENTKDHTDIKLVQTRILAIVEAMKERFDLKIPQ